MSNWSIETDESGRGTITHHAAPRFIAQWSSGVADLSESEGIFWYEAGSSRGEDGLTLQNFKWIDIVTEQDKFEKLMRQATGALDDWIAQRF